MSKLHHSSIELPVEQVTTHYFVGCLVTPDLERAFEIEAGSRVVLQHEVIPLVIETANICSLLGGERRLPPGQCLLRNFHLSHSTNHTLAQPPRENSTNDTYYPKCSLRNE